MWKKRLCRGSICFLVVVVGIVVLLLSLTAALSVRSPWTFADDWLAWFAGLSFIAGFAISICGAVASGIFLTELCGGP